MNTASLVFAAAGVCLGASVVAAQPSFDLLGVATPDGSYRATDISENGRVVVGLDGTGGVWRWERGVGTTPMPPITVAGGTGPCTVHNAFVSADGTTVVGDAGGQQCNGRVAQVYRWVFGSAPTIGPANTSATYYHISACSASGVPTGTVESFAYLSMYSDTWGGFPADAYDDNEPGCVPGDWIYSTGEGCTPDGLVLGSIWDCLESHRGGVWSGGTATTRYTQPLIAGAWNGQALISQTSKWTPASGWTPLFIPGSLLRDISWNGSVVVGDVSIGPTMMAGYHVDGVARDVRTALLAAGITQVQGTLLTVQAVSGDGLWITGRAVLPSGQMQPYVARLPLVCGDIDFNNDGLYPDTQDITDFIAVFAGSPCSSGNCDSIDFNADGLFPDASDVETLLRVFSGGPCTV